MIIWISWAWRAAAAEASVDPSVLLVTTPPLLLDPTPTLVPASVPAPHDDDATAALVDPASDDALWRAAAAEGRKGAICVLLHELACLFVSRQ